MLAQADVFVKYGLVERAVDHLRRVFALDPRHRGARERLASVLTQLGRRSEAAAELATLAGQLAEEDDADAALVAERALTLDPSCAAAAKLLGRKVAAPPAPEAIAAALTDELRGGARAGRLLPAAVAARRGARRCSTSSRSASPAIR